MTNGKYVVVFDRLGPNKCHCENPFGMGNAKGYVQGVCVSVVNGMNWVGTGSLNLGPRA